MLAISPPTSPGESPWEMVLDPGSGYMKDASAGWTTSVLLASGGAIMPCGRKFVTRQVWFRAFQGFANCHPPTKKVFLCAIDTVFIANSLLIQLAEFAMKRRRNSFLQWPSHRLPFDLQERRKEPWRGIADEGEAPGLRACAFRRPPWAPPPCPALDVRVPAPPQRRQKLINQWPAIGSPLSPSRVAERRLAARCREGLKAVQGDGTAIKSFIDGLTSFGEKRLR